jgi:hypothetical protein
MRFRKRNNNTYKKMKSLRRKHKNKQTKRRYKSRGGDNKTELIEKKEELKIITELLSILLPFKNDCNSLNVILSNTKTNLGSLKTEINTENGLITSIKDKLNQIYTFFQNDKVPLSIKDEKFKTFIEEQYRNIDYFKYLDLQDYIIITKQENDETQFINNIVLFIQQKKLAINYDDKHYEKIIKSSNINTLKDFIIGIYNKHKKEFQNYISIIVENVATFYTKVNNQKTDLESQIKSLENKIKALKPELIINNVSENK